MHWGKPTTLISFAVAVGVLYIGIVGAVDTLADVLRWANPFHIAADERTSRLAELHKQRSERATAHSVRDEEETDESKSAEEIGEGSGDCEEARELKKKGLEAGLDFILLESKEPPFDILPTYEEGYISCDSKQALTKALAHIKENNLKIGRVRAGTLHVARD